MRQSMHVALLTSNHDPSAMQNLKCASPSLLLVDFALTLTLVLTLVFGPTRAQAQLRDGATSPEKDKPSVEDLSIKGPSAEKTLPGGSTARRPLPPLRAVPDPAGTPLSADGPGLSLRALPSSRFSPRSASLPSIDPERLSPSQNLFWGTVGSALSLFCEAESASRLPAAGEGPRAHTGPIRSAPKRRYRQSAPRPGCDACDRARGRSAEALVEGLFNVGSYTKLK